MIIKTRYIKNKLLMLKHFLKLFFYHTKILKIFNKKKYNEFQNQIDSNKKSLKIEKQRIYKIPRYTEGNFVFENKIISFVDSASFLFMYNEIIERQIYKFHTTKKTPYIIDCGANIGLAIIYFKKLFPNAKITAFEPDPKIFSVLNKNCENYNFYNLTLLNKALWNEETILKFKSEGADAGKIINSNDKKSLIDIPTCRLRDFLHEEVDFLKIDIEGAETIVLQDSKDKLSNVKNLFVEYHSYKEEKQTLQEILSILSDTGFRYYIERVGISFSHPFVENKISCDFDLQLNIFGYRI